MNERSSMKVFLTFRWRRPDPPNRRRPEFQREGACAPSKTSSLLPRAATLNSSTRTNIQLEMARYSRGQDDSNGCQLSLRRQGQFAVRFAQGLHLHHDQASSQPSSLDTTDMTVYRSATALPCLNLGPSKFNRQLSPHSAYQ